MKSRAWIMSFCLCLLAGSISGCFQTTQQSAVNTNPAAVQTPQPKQTLGRLVNVQSGLNVREGPSTKHKVVGRLKPKDRFVIIEEQNGWCWVQKQATGDTVEGWASGKYIEIDDLAMAQSTNLSPSDVPQTDHSGMKSRTAVEGAVIGGALGALVGQLLGGSTEATLIGGAIGASIGTGAGMWVANKKEDYANDEAYLDACITESKQYNQVAKDSNDNLKKQISIQKKRIKALKSQVAAGTVDKDAIKAELKDLKAKQEAADQIIESLEAQIQAQETAVSQVSDNDVDQVGQLNNEIAICKREVIKLKKQREQLADIMSEMSQLTI